MGEKAMKCVLPTLLLAALLLTAVFLHPRMYSVAIREYSVQVHNLPDDLDGFTILHLTDLHSKRFGEGQRELLQLIRQCDYDIVAFTGDMVDRRRPSIEPAADLIRGLQDSDMFFVPGNHDHAADYPAVREVLVDMGVEILENRAVRRAVGQAHLWLVGVDDPSLGRANLTAALSDVTDDFPRILLAHAPAIYHQASEEELDVVLVGHTHGGQVRLPFVGAVYVPGQELFPEFDRGKFVSNEATMIINAGLGESVWPVRFFCRPEIALITLRSG